MADPLDDLIGPARKPINAWRLTSNRCGEITAQRGEIWKRVPEATNWVELSEVIEREGVLIAALAQLRAKQTREFPIQLHYRDTSPHPVRVPWSIAEKAYSVYAARYGRGQSLERLAERGGFTAAEMDDLHPQWRAEVSEISALRSEIVQLRTEFEDAQAQVAAIDDLPNAEGERIYDTVVEKLQARGYQCDPPEGSESADPADWIADIVVKLLATQKESIE